MQHSPPDHEKGEDPVIEPTESSSENQRSTKGNHMSIMTLQAQQPDGQPVTMTSREMADLTEKRHDSVKRTIDTLAARGAISQPQIVDGPKSANGVVEQVYLVGKRDSYVIVAQLSPEFTARLVDRWQELENTTAPAALNLRDPKQLAQVTTQLLALTNEQATQIASLEHQIEVDAPKVDGFERIALSDGDMNISLAAKSLGIDPLKRLFAWMQEHGWIYKRVGSNRWLAHQDKIKVGLLDHRNYPQRQDDGSEKLYPSVVVLPKGLAILAQQVPKDLSMPFRRNGYTHPYQPGASA